MLRHGANMDAGLLSFFSLEEQTSPGAPKSWLPGAETPTIEWERDLRLGGKVFLAFSAPPSPKHLKFLLCHQGSDLRRAKGTSAGSSMDTPGYWGRALFAFGAKEAQGYGESSSPHPPTAIGCQTQAQPQLPIICSPRPAQSRVPRRGPKDTLNFFFLILVFYLPAQPGAMESRRKSWAVFLEMLL